MSKGSKKILEQKKEQEAHDKSVHDRLYSTRQSQKQATGLMSPSNGAEMKKDGSLEKQMFVPSINKKSQKIKREGKVEELLAQDAKRRQEMQKMNQTQKVKQDEIPEDKKFKQISKNSQKFVYNRFEADFTQSLNDLELSHDSHLNKEKTH